MIRINLLADRQAKDRLIIQQQFVMGALVIVAAFVLCGFWWQVKSVQISNTNKKIVTAKQELDRQKKIRAEVSKMEARERRVKAILKAIDRLKKVKHGPTEYYDALNKLMPPEIWINNLADSSGSITLKGYSFSNNAIAQFMTNLEKSPHFGRVDLKEITKARFGKETIKQFSIRTMTSRGLKMAEEKKKRARDRKKSKRKKRKK